MLDKDLYIALNASKGVAGDLVGEQGEEQRHHPHPLLCRLLSSSGSVQLLVTIARIGVFIRRLCPVITSIRASKKVCLPSADYPLIH